VGVVEDLPILAGIILIVGGVVYAGGSSGLPGIGSLDNPIDTISSDTDSPEKAKHDLTFQYTIGSEATGGVYVNGFTYQTQRSCDLCLSIGEMSFLSVTGANNVRSEITVTNTETGRTVLQNTKFLGEVSGTTDEQIQERADNLEAGTYRIETKTTFEPKYFDLTSDGVIEKTWRATVPKVQN
jgi:hypothetical protein